MSRNGKAWWVAAAGLAFVAGRLSTMELGDGAWSIPAAVAQEAGGDAAPPEADPNIEALITAGEPGPNHRYLDAMIGTWDANVRVYMGPDEPPIDFPGSVTRQWVLDGRFVREDVRADGPFGHYEGVGYLGYNAIDGQYEFAWFENQSTAIMFETASFDPQRRLMRSRGTHRDPFTGQVISTRGEIDMSSHDRHRATGWAVGPDGREYKHFEGVFMRRTE